MLNKSNTTLIPDRTTLIESNGLFYLSFSFNGKQENLLVKLGNFEIDYLADEFDTIHQKALIATEYN